MKFLNLISGAFALISTVSAAPNTYSKDRCGECYPGYCCSKYGWCGQSNDHCSISNGCQSEFGDCNGNGNGNGSKPITKTSTTIVKPVPTSKPVDNVEWSGFRFSQGGVKENYGTIPTGDKWVGFLNKITKHFQGSKPTVVVIVSENSENVVCRFGFPKPSGVSKTKYMEFSSSDRFEDILNLQVEPGDNDLVTIAKIVFNQYGHHSCVQGFGIDLEWWYRYETGHGKYLSDKEAKRVVDYVRSVNSKYTVFAKHWETDYMPPTYRDHMIFVDDSQNLDNLSRMTKEFGKWAKYFPNNPVMYQIGYNEDYNIWKNDPIKVVKAVAKAASEYNDHVGILWVDFSMKKALEM
ncbi:carbohydrate-binding module family 18 protein, partial [Piromyces sp. E2]